MEKFISSQNMENGRSEQPAITEEDFKRQFVEQSVEIEGHKVHFTRVTPFEKRFEEPVIYVGGFSTPATVYRELQYHAQQGREVIFTNPTRGMLGKEASDASFEKLQVAETIQAKANEVAALLKDLDMKRVNVVGHSQGGAVGAAVAALHPDLIDNLILVNPSGMHGEDTALNLMGRTVKGQLRQAGSAVLNADFSETKRKVGVWVNVLKHRKIGEDVAWRFKKEIPGIVETNVLDILEFIKQRQQDKEPKVRTKVSLVTANKDDLFNAKKIDSNLNYTAEPRDEEQREEAFRKYIDMHAMYANKHASHDAPLYEKVGVIEQILNNQ